MRINALLLIPVLLGASVFAAATGRLSPRFHTVYILEMANGLDQHLANQLTANRALWVVLEPSSADAVLTPSLDDSFWNWLARTYPPPAGARPSAARSESQGSSRQAGMIFLVDPRARVVLWSAWDNPKRPTPVEVDRTASRIASQIKAAFDKK